MQSATQTRSKLPDVGTTIFTVIGQLAAQYDALNLSQGAPNFAPDAKLVDGVAQAMRAGHNQYAPMAGIATLREALADKVETLYGVRYDPSSEVTVIASASEGLYSTISALVHPGDEVIYFEPSFDSYGPIVRLQGATPVAIKLSLDDFRVDWDEVAAAITPKTRMIIINTPHNPTATVFSEADIARLKALTRNTDIVMLADALRESRFELLPSEGSFFMLARFRGFSDESDSDFVLRLIRDARVATIPLSAFYRRHGFRFDSPELLEGRRDADRRRAPFVPPRI